MRDLRWPWALARPMGRLLWQNLGRIALQRYAPFFVQFLSSDEFRFFFFFFVVFVATSSVVHTSHQYLDTILSAAGGDGKYFIYLYIV